MALFAGILGYFVLTVLRRRRQTPRERVEQFVDPTAADAEAEPSLTDRLASTTERSLSGSAWWERFSEAADVAGIPWPAARLLTNTLAIAAAAGLLLAAATGQILLFVVLVVLAPVVLSYIVRSRVRGSAACSQTSSPTISRSWGAR